MFYPSDSHARAQLEQKLRQGRWLNRLSQRLPTLKPLLALSARWLADHLNFSADRIVWTMLEQDDNSFGAKITLDLRCQTQLANPNADLMMQKWLDQQEDLPHARLELKSYHGLNQHQRGVLDKNTAHLEACRYQLKGIL